MNINIKTRFVIIFTVVLFCLICNISIADKAYDIMKKVEAASNYKTSKGEMLMIIVNDEGAKKKKVFKFANKKKKNDEKMSLIKFSKPKNIYRTGLLSIAKEGSLLTDQWFFLPALKVTKRIQSSEKSQSFMGSDFNFEDLSFEKIDNYTYTLIGEIAISKRACHIIKAVPKDDVESTYARKVLYIDKKINYPLKIDFYIADRKEKYKILNNSSIKKINGYPIARKVLMKNELLGSKTFLSIINISVDKPMTDSQFSRTALEK